MTARALLGHRRQDLLDKHVGHCVRNAAAAGDQNKARDMVTEATQPSPA